MRAAVVILALSVALNAAEPISFNEVSLLVRMRETDAEIVRQVGQRRLLRAIEPSQETALKAQGASDALLQVLRDPRLVLSEAEASAVEARREQAKKALEASAVEEAAAPKAVSPKDAFQLLQVSYGQSVNLSRWGGPSTEVKFFRKGGSVVAVSGRPAFIDPFARANETTSADPDPLHYYASNQILTVDPTNAVVVAGLPILYPVYEAGGVSLYLTNTSTLDTVTVAVRLPKR